MSDKAAYANGELDKEIVLSRVIDAPKDQVFRAWIEPEHMFRWFGPRGFHCDVREAGAARAGAMWRFAMIAPNGHRYDSRMVFLEVIPNERLVLDHGADKDDDPHRFRVTITFDQQSDGKTVLTLRQLHPSKAQRDGTIGFGAVELGYQTLDKMDEYLHGH
ncbi:MAG: SRPBCC domain-containing protein [Steroidobacteraceae bacterium]